MAPLELSAEQLRDVLNEISALAQGWLAGLDERRIAPGVSGAEVEQRLGSPLPEHGEGVASLAALSEVMRCARAQNGRFWGYVLGSAEPVAAAADLLASAMNQNVTAWRSAPAGIAIEKVVVASLARAIGCEGFAGSLTGGGSAANLMGLAIAREAKVPANEDGARQAIVYASSEVHMSISKAVALLGIGRKQLRLVPVDARFKMIPEELEAAIASDKAEGRSPFAVVATAGTVTTGAVDPLVPIADIARRHDLWFHVDGAYGALAAIAAPDLLAGLRGADSLSLDAHKWFYQPLDCGCLLYRDRSAAQRAFSFTGDYARALQSDPFESFAFFEESPELSRRFRALKIWLSWRFHGLAAFREAIAADLRHARRLADAIGEDASLELLAPVELSVVCFRSLHPDGANDRDAWNRALLERLNGRGRVYLSNATVRGQYALRACFTNHRTSDADIEELLRELRALLNPAGR
jgi:glutamate/tyrosine decarboxylase-like PLP-dependent enzyme